MYVIVVCYPLAKALEKTLQPLQVEEEASKNKCTTFQLHKFEKIHNYGLGYLQVSVTSPKDHQRKQYCTGLRMRFWLESNSILKPVRVFYTLCYLASRFASTSL
ncbi:hypothetical protein PGT21_008400 [Puccinia graminis f. sp. tritici]|uniref:Uncharacterized protein n=1 Tax=Puccinia graminis f. sp. tritici TaxID=56615 RepID=A0A5B0NMK6_PUCGR|nr:hypothetical protein PGT21_008400 [Puccinia graminis f. sp. tritici]